MEKDYYGTREYWSKHLDSVFHELQNDKEKILDIIMDKCIDMDIRIHIAWGETPTYEITHTKSAIELLLANKK